MKLFSRVRLFSTPWTAAYQAPPSMGFSRQEFWSGVPLPSPNVCVTCPFSGLPQTVIIASYLPLCELVTQSCLTLRDPRDCSLPGSFVHGIFQARVLEWVAIYYLAIKKNKSLPFAATWMDSEGIMLNEVSQTERDKYCMIIPYVESKKIQQTTE